jgi:hypothetical protein
MNSTLCFNPTHQTGRLTFSDDEAVEVGLTGWTFPFHGNRYTSVWIGSNGYVTFGGPDTAWSPWPTAFVGGVGRVAAFWSDLDPSAGGEVLVTQSAGSMTVTWNNLPYYLTPGTASCSLTLNGDGTIYLSWGPVAPQPVLVLVGQTAGYPATMGTEGPAPLTPGGIHGSGPGAVYDMMIATSFPYASNQVAFDAAHTANAHPLPIGNDGAVEVLFPGGFTFPFGTGRHDAAFFNADGYLSFGGTDGARFGTPARLLGFFPRICGLWADYRTMLYGGPEAVLTVVAGPGTLAFRWYLGAAQFAILLRTDGSFSLVYGAVSSPATSVAGYSTGGGTATGSEAQVALTSRTSWGSGTETAIFQEVLTPSTLAWQTFSFAPAGPILYQRPVTSPGAIPIALGAGAADAGLVWVIGAALGSQPGIALPGCGTIPLNPDPVLQLTMGGALIQPFLGALDGRGERTGWPVARLSPVTLQVPAGLGGLGLVLWVAIVTVAPPGSPCPFRTISPAVPFRI